MISNTGGTIGVTIDAMCAADHAQVERFVRYLARPPIAQERLELLDAGTVRYGFKRPWKDGSTAVHLHPFDLLARLCALIPPPRMQWCATTGCCRPTPSSAPRWCPSRRSPSPTPSSFSRGYRCASMRRTSLAASPGRGCSSMPGVRGVPAVASQHDVSVCPRCQGPTTWLEVATEPDAIDRALVEHGLAPPRAPPPALPPLCPDAQRTLPL